MKEAGWQLESASLICPHCLENIESEDGAQAFSLETLHEMKDETLKCSACGRKCELPASLVMLTSDLAMVNK